MVIWGVTSIPGGKTSSPLVFHLCLLGEGVAEASGILRWYSVGLRATEKAVTCVKSVRELRARPAFAPGLVLSAFLPAHSVALAAAAAPPGRSSGQEGVGAETAGLGTEDADS